MSEKYPDSMGDAIALVGAAAAIAIIILLASFFLATPANAFPSDWSSEQKTCSEAGSRPGTDKPAWCPEFKEDGSIGCVPCPRAELVQWVGHYRKRTWPIDRRRRACQQTKRCW